MDTFETMHRQMSDDLMSGDLRTILDYFELPMAIYAGDTTIVCQNEDHFLELAGQYQLLMTQGGIARYETRATPEPNTSSGNGTIWIDKTYLNADDNPVDTSRLRYFVRMDNRKPKICMVEYVKLPSLFDITKLNGKSSPRAALAQLHARPSREVGDELPGNPA